jgi:hypothetical protein
MFGLPIPHPFLQDCYLPLTNKFASPTDIVETARQYWNDEGAELAQQLLPIGRELNSPGKPGARVRFAPESDKSLRCSEMSAPAVQEESGFLRSVRVQPCIRPVFAWRSDVHCDAAAVAAGPDVIG